MAPDASDVVRALFERTNQRDLEGATDLLHPNVVWEAPPRSPGSMSKTYRGREGYRELMNEVGSEGGVWMTLLDVELMNEQTVIASAAFGTASRGGMVMSLSFQILDDKVSHVRIFQSR